MGLTLAEILDPISNEAFKHWLKVNGLKHTAKNQGVLLELVQKLIDSGDLTVPRITEAVREIEEHGGKRLYLGHIDEAKAFTDKNAFIKHLNSLDLELSPEPCSTRRLPSKPKLNYLCWTGKEIRIKFSETHQEHKVDFDAGTVDWVDKTKVIVIATEPKTGFTKILMDSPERKHPHLLERGRNSGSYEEYYIHKALELLNGITFEFLNVETIIEKLIKIKPPIFEPTNHQVVTSEGYKIRYSGRSSILQETSYKLAEGVKDYERIPEATSGEWLPERSGDKLQRRVFMQVSERLKMVRFDAHCLPSEVEYAVSTIRSL